MSGCVFCAIAAGTAPAQVFYEDDEFIVFRNVLRWLPVMLLVVPRRHRTQEELWGDLGRAGRVALAMGRRFCPNGFRLVSNFGWDALQSQPHAHIHVLGGAGMEPLSGRGGGREPVLEQDTFRVERRYTGWPPVVLVAEPRREMDQDALWADVPLLGAIGAELVRLGREWCPYGFRLASDFGWDALQSQVQAHVSLLGGAELGHYV